MRSEPCVRGERRSGTTSRRRSGAPHADVVIGYLHRGFEKMCERGTWSQAFPCMDRLNYVSPMLNNVAFALACEKLLGVEAPVRAQWYRMALGELSRITDHLTCTAAMPMDLGAYTPFLWHMRAREMILDIFEEEAGAPDLQLRPRRRRFRTTDGRLRRKHAASETRGVEHLVSDGSGTPHRIRIRPPCFYITAGVERMITGQMLADVVPCFGSVNMVGGECDH